MWEYYLVDVLNSSGAVASLLVLVGAPLCLIFPKEVFKGNRPYIFWLTVAALLIVLFVPSKEVLELMLLGY